MARQSPRQQAMNRKSLRQVDRVGTDEGQADEIADLVGRKTALSGLGMSKPSFSNPLNSARNMVGKMKTGFGRLIGKREHTPAEEKSFKQRGQKAYWEGRIKK